MAGVAGLVKPASEGSFVATSMMSVDFSVLA
jgi:hypothetical protein